MFLLYYSIHGPGQKVFKHSKISFKLSHSVKRALVSFHLCLTLAQLSFVVVVDVVRPYLVVQYHPITVEERAVAAATQEKSATHVNQTNRKKEK